MAGILSTTISGLLAYQRGLATASHNVANAETPGVQVTTVRRQYDEFLAASLREATAGFERLSAYTELARQVDDLLADPEAGV